MGCGTQQFTGAGHPAYSPFASFGVDVDARFSVSRCTWFAKYGLFGPKPPVPFDMYAAGLLFRVRNASYNLSVVGFFPAFLSALTNRSAITHSFGATSSVRVWPFASMTSPAGTPACVFSFSAASIVWRHLASNALSFLTAFFAATARVSHVVTHGTVVLPMVAGTRLAPNCVHNELDASISMYLNPASDLFASSMNAEFTVNGTTMTTVSTPAAFIVATAAAASCACFGESCPTMLISV